MSGGNPPAQAVDPNTSLWAPRASRGDALSFPSRPSARKAQGPVGGVASCAEPRSCGARAPTRSLAPGRRVATPNTKTSRIATDACLRLPLSASSTTRALLARRACLASASGDCSVRPALSYAWTMLPLLRSFVPWTCQGSCCIFGPLLLPPSP